MGTPLSDSLLPVATAAFVAPATVVKCPTHQRALRTGTAMATPARAAHLHRVQQELPHWLGEAAQLALTIR